MTHQPEYIATESADRTTWMRRYTLDPALAEQFLDFLRTSVFPARESRGFTVESVWLDSDHAQLTWFVSYPGNAEDYAAAEKAWEESSERAEIFAGTPAFVTGKDLRPVTRLR